MLIPSDVNESFQKALVDLHHILCGPILVCEPLFEKNLICD